MQRILAMEQKLQEVIQISVSESARVQRNGTQMVLKFNSNSKGFQRMGKDKYILKNHDQVSLQLGENSLTRE